MILDFIKKFLKRHKESAKGVTIGCLLNKAKEIKKEYGNISCRTAFRKNGVGLIIQYDEYTGFHYISVSKRQENIKKDMESFIDNLNKLQEKSTDLRFKADSSCNLLIRYNEVTGIPYCKFDYYTGY